MKVLIRFLVSIASCVAAAATFNACGLWKRTPTPDTATASTAVQVPAGCTENFSGTWVHADDSSYTYRAHDDGGTLLLTAFRLWPPTDGGSPPADAGPALAAEVSLQRTGNGFIGTTRATAAHPSFGRSCPVAFPTEVIRCEDGGLTLKSATVTSVGEACQASPSTVAPIMLEHRLARADAGAL